MTQLTFGYSDSEDRIWLRYSDDEGLLWMTRRLANGFLRHLVELMTVSCPGAGENAGPSLDAGKRLELEHETANEILDEQAAASGGPPTPPVMQAVAASHRLTSIKLSVDANRVSIEFVAPNYQRPTQMSRAEAHALLKALAHRCQTAGWNLTTIPAWIGPPPG